MNESSFGSYHSLVVRGRTIASECLINIIFVSDTTISQDISFVDVKLSTNCDASIIAEDAYVKFSEKCKVNLPVIGNVIGNQEVTVSKLGGNDPCPCGSGKKYKNCCGKEDSISSD